MVNLSASKEVLIIGPDSTGGVTSVIKMHLRSGLGNIRFIPTYNGKNLVITYLLFLIKYMAVLITDKNLKIVHIHSASRGSFLRKFIAVNIAKIFKKKVIFHIHGAEFNIFYDESPKFIKYLIKNTLDKADLILVLSKQWKKDVAEKTNNKKIQVLYNPTVIRHPSLCSGSIVNVIFTGRVGKRKGVYDLLNAAKYIHNPNIKIWIYGDGDIEKARKLVYESNLQDRVNIGGWISGLQLEEVYQKADIFVLPSYNEGLPMSILEALSCGLPVISTPVGGIPEAVFENQNGYLIAPGDYINLAEKIEFLATNKDLRVKMGNESYKIAREKFDINIITSELENIYANIW